MLQKMSVIALLFFMLACGAPKRPAHVPEGAFWGGSRKEGAFILIEKKHGLGWYMKVYNKEGVLQKDGLFVVNGPGRSEIYGEEVLSFDGQNILLKDGGRLEFKP